ncbi:MAG TPA: glycoside hydrolase family 16 protein [Propionibacteriaceae bacterium]|nr:glycoside hydrolase family 16 protein [Propionibacteriaceae bacterium]
MSADSRHRGAKHHPRHLRRRLAGTLVTGLVVLTVIASLAVFDVWPRVGAAILSRTGISETATTVVLDESFDGDALDTTVWNTCHWWADQGCTISSNDELEWYRPEQVSVSDGALRLTADRIPTRGSDGRDYEYRSGMVTTGPSSHESEAKVSWTYGTVEARLRVPEGRGLWAALWMLPASGESRPEIDIMEVIGQNPGENIMHLHPADRSEDSPSSRYRLPGKSLAEGWHTIRLDWEPRRLTFFVDGKDVWRVTGDQVPDEPMYLVINLAVGGVYPGPPGETTKFPATFEIDRVRITTPD